MLPSFRPIKTAAFTAKLLQCYHDKNNYGNKEFSEEEGESSQESQDFATESEGSQFKPNWALGLA